MLAPARLALLGEEHQTQLPCDPSAVKEQEEQEEGAALAHLPA